MPPKKVKIKENKSEVASQHDINSTMDHTKQLYQSLIKEKVNDHLRDQQRRGELDIPPGLLTELTKRWLAKVESKIEEQRASALAGHSGANATTDDVFVKMDDGSNALPPRKLCKKASGSYKGLNYKPKTSGDAKVEVDNTDDLMEGMERPSPKMARSSPTISQSKPQPSAPAPAQAKPAAATTTNSDSDSDDGYDDALFTTTSQTTESGLQSRYGEEIAAAEASVEPFDDLSDINIDELKAQFAAPSAGDGMLYALWEKVNDKKDGVGFNVKGSRGAVLRVGGIEAVVSMNSAIEADFQHGVKEGVAKRKR